MTYIFDVLAGRSGSSFPGSLTRVLQPYEAVTALPYATTPPTRFGDPVMYQAPGIVRPVLVGDAVGSSNFSQLATSTGTNTVVTFANTTGVAVGQLVTGAGITPPVTVVSFIANTSVTLSASITWTATAYTFTSVPTVTPFGFTIKAFPTTQATWPPVGFNTVDAPSTTDTLNIMRGGYIAVAVVYGTPVQGNPVYVRTVSSGNNTTIGSLDATSEVGKNVVLNGVTWAVSGVDTNGYGEIRVTNIA